MVSYLLSQNKKRKAKAEKIEERKLMCNCSNNNNLDIKEWLPINALLEPINKTTKQITLRAI